ncbi:hypothetical protein R3P38DRAFT_1957092 [Favolaschia claudopus]|uniref:Pectinesterase n=1 Tax=Favolaschia claudopus TaxID=2862362 RepID=A0AAV9ZZJ1_9AGAR
MKLTARMTSLAYYSTICFGRRAVVADGCKLEDDICFRGFSVHIYLCGIRFIRQQAPGAGLSPSQLLTLFIGGCTGGVHPAPPALTKPPCAIFLCQGRRSIVCAGHDTLFDIGHCRQEIVFNEPLQSIVSTGSRFRGHVLRASVFHDVCYQFRRICGGTTDFDTGSQVFKSCVLSGHYDHRLYCHPAHLGSNSPQLYGPHGPSSVLSSPFQISCFCAARSCSTPNGPPVRD